MTTFDSCTAVAPEAIYLWEPIIFWVVPPILYDGYHKCLQGWLT